MRHKILLSFVVALAIAALLVFGFRAEVRRWAYEPAGRDEWQQPERVMQALALEPGQHVADIGTGGGYFTFRMARAVGPAGRVFAVDIDADMVSHVKARAQRDGLSNIETILAAPDDPRLAAESVDVIFLCNTYHHIESRAGYFRRAGRALRPQGRVVIVEFKPEGWFARWFGHATPADMIRSEMEAAGYRLAQQHDFLERQHFMMFAR